MRRLTVTALAGAVLALALAGCATGPAAPGGDGGSEAGTPGGAAADTQPGGSLDVGAAWLAGGSLVAIVTHGSSTPTCAPIVDDVTLDDGVLVVALAAHPDAEKGCDGDDVPQGTVVGVPEGVQPGTGVDIQVTYDAAFGEVRLDGYRGAPADEYMPSAGWVDDNTLALLTWGSSSCAPTVESATATSPTTIDVAFAAQDADQPCTMDMAPRVAVVTIDGEVSRDATVSIAGGSALPGMSIPVD